MDRREFLIGAAVVGGAFVVSRSDDSGSGETAPVPSPSDLLEIASSETVTIVSSTIENYDGVLWEQDGALEIESGGALEINQ